MTSTDPLTDVHGYIAGGPPMTQPTEQDLEKARRACEPVNATGMGPSLVERVALALAAEREKGTAWRNAAEELLADLRDRVDLLLLGHASARREIARLEAEVVKARADEREACADTAQQEAHSISKGAHGRIGCVEDIGVLIAAAIRSRT